MDALVTVQADASQFPEKLIAKVFVAAMVNVDGPSNPTALADAAAAVQDTLTENQPFCGRLQPQWTAADMLVVLGPPFDAARIYLTLTPAVVGKADVPIPAPFEFAVPLTDCLVPRFRYCPDVPAAAQALLDVVRHAVGSLPPADLDCLMFACGHVQPDGLYGVASRSAFLRAR